MTERYQEKQGVDFETGVLMIIVAALTLFSRMRDETPNPALQNPQDSRLVSPIDIFENIESSSTPSPTPTEAY